MAALLGPGMETARKLGKSARVPSIAGRSSMSQDKLSNQSQSMSLIEIAKALSILLPSGRAADEWVKRPNAAPLLHGQSALERMLGDSPIDLADVRRYLDAQRGL